MLHGMHAITWPLPLNLCLLVSINQLAYDETISYIWHYQPQAKPGAWLLDGLDCHSTMEMNALGSHGHNKHYWNLCTYTDKCLKNQKS